MIWPILIHCRLISHQLCRHSLFNLSNIVTTQSPCHISSLLASIWQSGNCCNVCVMTTFWLKKLFLYGAVLEASRAPHRRGGNQQIPARFPQGTQTHQKTARGPERYWRQRLPDSFCDTVANDPGRMPHTWLFLDFICFQYFDVASLILHVLEWRYIILFEFTWFDPS